MQSVRIAFKNVSRQLKRSLLLGGAIAFGFFIFMLVNGFTGGLLNTLESNFAQSLGGHIYISGTEVSEQGSEISLIQNDQVLEDALATIKEDLLSYNTRSSANSTVIFGSKEASLSLNGVDLSQGTHFLNSISLLEGNAEDFYTKENAVLLPSDVLTKLGADIGESILIKTSTIKGQQNVTDGVIVGSIELLEGPPGVGSGGYVNLNTLNTLLAIPTGQYQALNLYLNDLGAIDSVTEILHSYLADQAVVEPREESSGFRRPDFASAFGLAGLNSVDETERWEGTKFTVSNLNDQMDGVMALVNIMNGLGLSIFLIVLAIIMVGVMNSYRMVMFERTAEIGTMRAMGMQKAGIRNIFIWEAFFIALGGALVGLVSALLFMGGVGFIDFSATNTFTFFLNQGHLQFSITAFNTLTNILLICLMSIASVFIPARAAANLQPAEALRTSY